MPVPIDIAAVPEAFRPFAAALFDRADTAERLLELLGTLGEKADKRQAADFALLLRRALPPGTRLARVTDCFLREKYPVWYIRAVNDRHRNAAYRRAIEAAVQPGSIVLELGTGSGLFAMMAARAGADHVFGCELDDVVRAMAEKNIRTNGLEDRITLLGDYKKIELGHDLPRLADVLIHEFVGSEYLTHGMADMLGELRTDLVRPDAAILPQYIAVRAMLTGDIGLLDDIRIGGPVEGFDLSAINLLAPSSSAWRGPFTVDCALSEPLTAIEHDIAGGGPPQRDKRVKFQATADGAATGLIQWVRHRFPDGTHYENSPDRACNWWPAFWPFPEPVAVQAGQTLAVRCRASETELFFDLA